MAKIISSLFKRGGQTLPYQQQENLFEKIKIELDHTNMVQVCNYMYDKYYKLSLFLSHLV